MSHEHAALSRRELLAAGAGAAAAGLLAATPGARAASRLGAWPDRRLPLAAAEEIVPSQFLPTAQLAAWGKEVDALGLRATGSAVHERYVRTLASRLRTAGLTDVALEAVPMTRWTATRWSLSIAGTPLENVFYHPYSKPTGPAGLTAPTVYVGSTATLADYLADHSVAGKIVVFDVDYTKLPLSVFKAISYPDAFYDAPKDPRDFTAIYQRPWLNDLNQSVVAMAKAGAAGLIGIWNDLPGHWARQYTPYNGTLTTIPGLWVDMHDGVELKAQAAAGATARITLEARTARTRTHNVVGFIPGRSKELTVLHTHTDGTNGMEENGQLPIIATAQYLARLPRKARERTIMVLLSSGHFAGGVGIRGWLERHAGDLARRVTSIQTLEHVGCLQLLPDGHGAIKNTKIHEQGTWFAPDSKGLVAALRRSVRRDGLTGTVARPFVSQPDAPKQKVGWPGEGTYFWIDGGLRDGNYITGPYGLITAGLDTTGMVDYALMRKKAMTAVRTTLELAATDAAELKASAG